MLINLTRDTGFYFSHLLVWHGLKWVISHIVSVGVG